MRPISSLRFVLSGLFLLGLELLLVASGPVASASAHPLDNFPLYLPLVSNYVPPSADPIQLHADVGPNCASAYQFNGVTDLTVTGPATRVVVETTIHHYTPQTGVRWVLHYSTNLGGYPISWVDQTGHALVDIAVDNSVPCTHQFPTGDFAFQLYVNNVLQQTGTFHLR